MSRGGGGAGATKMAGTRGKLGPWVGVTRAAGGARLVQEQHMSSISSSRGAATRAAEAGRGIAMSSRIINKGNVDVDRGSTN